MVSRFASSTLLVTLSVLGLLANLGYIPSVPIIPAAQAGPGGSAALLGLWNATKKSNADFDLLVTAGKTFVMDVNSTNAGPLIQAEIGLNWTGTSSPGLAVTHVAWDASNGLTGGIFDCVSRGCGDTALKTLNQTTFIDYVLQDNALTIPSGTGIIMRVTFKVLVAGSYNIHLNVPNDARGGTGSVLFAPSPIAYQTIDGYFSDVSGSDNYSISSNQGTVIVFRTVSGTNLTQPVATITLTLTAGLAHLTTLTVLGLPRNAVAVQSAPSCTPPCSITIQIQVTGGLAASSTTTPSGTYSLVVVGNSSAVGGSLMKYTGLTLIVKPPRPATFTIGASRTNFEQINGTSIIIKLLAFLTCTPTPTVCPNEPVGWSTNGGGLTGATFSFSPSNSQSFPLSSVMNITVPSDTFTFGIIPFVVTATTTGIYSEVSTTRTITLTIDIVQAYGPLEKMARGFSYNSISLGLHPNTVSVTINNTGTTTQTSIPVNATAKVALQSDPLIKFVNTTNVATETWAAGKVVVYDTNGNGVYNTGEPVISGSAPVNGRPIRYDRNIMFSDLHYSGVWAGKTTETPTGDPVAYETDGNGLYDTGGIIINGTISTGILVGSTTIASLAPGASTTVTFNWDPSALPRGVYQVVGAGGLPTPVNRGVVNFVQKYKGDVNGDCVVDIGDLVSVANKVGSTPTSAKWNPNSDLNNDALIDIVDIVLISGPNAIGHSC